jgi:hypothetical protein
LLVQERDRAIAGVSCGQLGTVRLKFRCQSHFWELLDTEIVGRERRLAADKGIASLMLAIEYEDGASELVYSVVIENKGYYFWREANVVFFSFGRI